MDKKMIEQLRKDDLKGDRLAAKLLEVIFGLGFAVLRS